MAPSGDDNLGDLLSQMNDAGDTSEAANAAATSAAPRPVHKPGPVRPPKASNKLKIIVTLLAYLVGLGLMGFAGYGAMILGGAVEVEKENAEDMAKLMLFTAGPIGAILLIAALALSAQMMFKR